MARHDIDAAPEKKARKRIVGIVDRRVEVSPMKLRVNRDTGLGGTDVATLVTKTYRSPLRVYSEKNHLIDDDFVGSERMQWGNALEEPIAREYARRHHVKLRAPRCAFRHPRNKWMIGSPDRFVMRKDRILYGLEIKMADRMIADRWGDPNILPPVVPLNYFVQLSWYMAVFELYRWDLAVLIGGNEFREYTFYRDEAYERELVETARAFWYDNVLAHRPPYVDGSDSSRETIGMLHPIQESDVIIANSVDGDLWAHELREAKAIATEATERVIRAENELKLVISNRMGISGPWGRVTWKSGEMSRVDYKSLALSMTPSREQIQSYTKTTPTRRFLTRFKEQD